MVLPANWWCFKGFGWSDEPIKISINDNYPYFCWVILGPSGKGEWHSQTAARERHGHHSPGTVHPGSGHHHPSAKGHWSIQRDNHHPSGQYLSCFSNNCVGWIAMNDDHHGLHNFFFTNPDNQWFNEFHWRWTSLFIRVSFKPPRTRTTRGIPSFDRILRCAHASSRMENTSSHASGGYSVGRTGALKNIYTEYGSYNPGYPICSASFKLCCWSHKNGMSIISLAGVISS